MYLFFDTETTGLPRNWKAPVTDLGNWPRMVQLAYILCDGQGRTLRSGDTIIFPDDFEIPEEAARVHGITTARARREGAPLAEVLSELYGMIGDAEYLVAHNMSFDEKIIGAEFLRVGPQNPIAAKRRICTMLLTTDYCAIPGKYGYKWPKLSELHTKLFGEDFEEAHDAAVDIGATSKCFWELKRRRII